MSTLSMEMVMPSRSVSKMVKATSCRALADGSVTITQECALGLLNESFTVSDRSNYSILL